MRVLAVIPARAGSQGVPGKNLRKVAGRPLVEWSIDAAAAATLVDLVCLSSDSREVLSLLRLGPRGYSLPRPAELATAEAATDPVLVHAVLELERHAFPRPDYVVLLQPTVPVRRPGLVDDCIRRAVETEADSLFTAYPLHFVWWREEAYSQGPGPVPRRWATQCPRRPRRQDMHARELMYHEDGSVYVVRTSYLLEHGARLGGHVEVYETERTVDIDTERDLHVADGILRAGQRREERSA